MGERSPVKLPARHRQFAEEALTKPDQAALQVDDVLRLSVGLHEAMKTWLAPGVKVM